MKRIAICFAALAAMTLSSAALAQSASEEGESPTAATAPAESSPMQNAAEKLSDPATQETLSDEMETMSKVMLNMPIAPLIEAMRGMAGEDVDVPLPDVPADATLRSLMGEDAERATTQASERLPELMDRAGEMAQGLDAMIPVLETMAARMKQAMPETR